MIGRKAVRAGGKSRQQNAGEGTQVPLQIRYSPTGGGGSGSGVLILKNIGNDS